MIWKELGIAATDDAKLIRSAYASRLKRLDADRDSAAFLRLRHAYEAALSAAYAENGSAGQVMIDRRQDCDRGEVDRDLGTLVCPVGQEAEESKYASEEFEAEPYGAFQRFCEMFEESIGAGCLRQAVVFLLESLARGIIPIGSVESFVRLLTDKALADQTLSAGDLEAMAELLNNGGGTRLDDPLAVLSLKLLARAEAERWYSRIKAQADGPWWRGFSQPTRVARVILGRGFKDIEAFDLRQVCSEVEFARRHAPYLMGRVDPTHGRQFVSKHWTEFSGIYTSLMAYGLAIVAATLLAVHFPLN